MTQKPQWTVQVPINAPASNVWNFIEDLSLIPTYHPVVRSVEFLSGPTRRAPGVEYKCVIPEGPQKGWCVERVIENVPHQKMTISCPQDSWGISKLLDSFVTELTLEPAGDDRTIVRLIGYYNTIGLKARLMNIMIIRRMMRKRATDTLLGLKALVESRGV